MTNAADIGTTFLVGNFIYGGSSNSNDALDMMGNPNSFQGSAFQELGGYAANAGAIDIENSVSPQGLDQNFGGYAATFDGVVPSIQEFDQELSKLTDNEPTRPWPKDQQIYYKLVGYNTNTQTFETWIIIEDIVTRTETFDPSGSFPNIDYNVYFTPPSGNPLENIKIVGRWIQ